ncbi:MAG: pirin family protein [Proteobacteria bacterium]|nr:pirin family protein [Pseudomonadota bacterium]
MRKLIAIQNAPNPHWVGDGFPVRSLFSPQTHGAVVSPFILLDHAAPYRFGPAAQKRGVGVHPHRGFETVTIVYSGEVDHRDSTGNGGHIGPGDVQWMTAASGILHEEFHSEGFTRSGGVMEMVQLWVNLPAKQKMAPPGYQTLLNAQIPTVELPDAAGVVRVIAGNFSGHRGPARTFTPIDIWDVRLNASAKTKLTLPEGHTLGIVVLSGAVRINGVETAGEGQFALFAAEGGAIALEAEGEAKVLVLSGEPIDEPIAAYGPFVMNTNEEIRQAIVDFNNGRFGDIGAFA